MTAIARFEGVFEKLGLETRDLLDLGRTVAETGSKRVDLVLREQSATQVVQVLDQPVTLGAGASLELAGQLADLAESAAMPDALGELFPASAPPGTRAAVFTVAGRLGASAAGSTPVGTVGTISASLIAGAACKYRQITPVSPNDSIATALTKCVGTARLPGPRWAEGLVPGQSRSFSGHLSAGLNVRVSGGTSLKLKRAVDIFTGLPDLEMAAEAAVSAALGLALDGSLTFSARKGATATSPVRLRVDRTSSRKLSLGLAVAAKADTNAGSVLAEILNHVFELDPVAEALNVLAEVAALENVSAWRDLPSRLVDLGAERFEELVEDNNWINWESERVDNFIAFAKATVEAWAEIEKLDERLRGWLDCQLTAVGLAPGSQARIALSRVSALDANAASLSSVLSDELRRAGSPAVVTLLELLTGRSLEQLLAHPLSEIDPIVRRVVSDAKKVEELLNGLDDDQLEIVGRFARKSGLEAVVTWLEANATSVPALQGAMSKVVRKVVSRVVGKAWESIDEADIERIRAFARRVAEALVELDEWREAVTEDLKRIDRGLGFRIGLQIERVITQEAILDFEIAESDTAFASIARAFGLGRIADVLELIAEVFSAEDDGGEHRIVVRECAILSRFVQTSALTSVLAAFGIEWLSSRTVKRFYQRALTLSQGSNSPRAAYVAGAHVSEAAKDGIFAASIEFGFDALGSLGRDHPYTSVRDGRLRLTVQVEDPRIDPGELVALDELLADTRFTGPFSVVATRQPGHTALKFALELAIAGPVARFAELLDRASSSRDRWTDAVFLGAKRWVAEGLISESEASVHGVRAGAIMAALFADAAFVSQLRIGQQEATSALRQIGSVNAKGQPVSLLVGGGQDVHPALRALTDCIPFVRGESFRRLEAFKRSPIKGGRKPAEVFEAAKQFSRLASSITPNDTLRNPLLGFWILWHLVSGHQDLEVRGVAICRFSEAKEDSPWTAPAVWTA